ncbi:MAG: hypothetical protein WA210_14295 [Burkholderiaceae bacterium]
MVIGWLTVLKSVPWVEVISNAPKIADGAKKLWSSVGKNSAAAQPAAAGAQVAPETEANAAIQARLATLESAASDLHDQMLASSELIKELAEQNAQLIKGIEANRIRMRWLLGAVVGLAIVAVAGLVLALGR